MAESSKQLVERPHAPRRRAQRAALPNHAEKGLTIVAIGASAGGLDACRKLLTVLPAQSGMAFVVIQHLDPTHDSLLVELLSTHTTMHVCQAVNGMKVLPDHVYIIPPGTYLSLDVHSLRVSAPDLHHGARLPFDCFLTSLAATFGAHAVCIVLSGTGSDGSRGLRDIKEAGGLVIAETPEEADYDGMPRNAIATGAVDAVLGIAAMPEAIVAHAALLATPAHTPVTLPRPRTALQNILDLLRSATTHDFTLYKAGTLERRIGRRMAMSGIDPTDMAAYLTRLREDATELQVLAKDMLINVTSLFRDAAVFKLLENEVIPDLVRSHTPDQTIRLWVAGCSTGEETYSLAMLFREEIASAKMNIKLQIFASDLDSDAVAIGREGLYSEAVVKDITPARLAQFFSKEDHGYRVSAELRSSIVFTVQDVLADPPFSRMDMISCRNLLIYLQPEAQAKVISLFHFSLRQGGLLLLGSAETIADPGGRFEVASKSARLFRHIARSRPGELSFSMNIGDNVRSLPRTVAAAGPSRHYGLAELCRRLVLENYAPAAVLINQKHECLFTLGPLDKYLRVAPGQPTHDVLAMARAGLRTKLRAAIQQAWNSPSHIKVPGGRLTSDASSPTFDLDIYPLQFDAEALLLICFTDIAKRGYEHGIKHGAKAEAEAVLPGRDAANQAELERELEATRAELRAAISSLEMSGEEQTAINEEALSVNEEYQSTNEELLTSKEELQSLNEELTALNSQLQETLERQRTTANDLQNVLFSTDVATLFLDRALRIRFFTPATKSLFNVIAADIGRPLSDLKSLAIDGGLLDEAKAVLADHKPAEREVSTPNGNWYLRRILPYRAQSNEVEGVVITFADVTERRHTAETLEATKREAERANTAKSRFLAAASHDLRQPLQALTLLQGLLAKTVEGAAAQRLVALLDPTLSAMTSMLNTLLDINQIDSGTVKPAVEDVAIGPMLARLKDEFGLIAVSCGLTLHVVACNHVVQTDPRLLEQMLRNLLSNALKYTPNGKVLLGCRHTADRVLMQVCDNGIGIAERELAAIFDEYHQVDNDARERSRGLGLGLSIVKRLGDLLGHGVSVQSRAGKGSVFTISIARRPEFAIPTEEVPVVSADNRAVAVHQEATQAPAAILAIEDDPDLRTLLNILLKEEGYQVATAANGVEALALVSRGKIRPDIVLADYNLPLSMTGLEVAAKLRERMHADLPVIILTGDISTEVLRAIAAQDCVHMVKPVKTEELSRTIRRLSLVARQDPTPVIGAALTQDTGPPIIYVVDDDAGIRRTMLLALEKAGHLAQAYASCEDFLAAYRPGHEACLLVDAYLPGMDGVDLLQFLREKGLALPSIMITGESDVAMAVRAMKAGAIDLLEKPVDGDDLLACVDRALELARDSGKLTTLRQTAHAHLADLTPRQIQIMTMVLAGTPSKNIAADLGISRRTVENHRASIMHRTGSRSLPALARLVAAASWDQVESRGP
jgi:two-component system CheB/CheR fusion protein